VKILKEKTKLKPKIPPKQVKQVINPQKRITPLSLRGQSRNKNGKKENLPEKKFVTVEFPIDNKIYNYDFIAMQKKWFTALGWEKGMLLKIKKTSRAA